MAQPLKRTAHSAERLKPRGLYPRQRVERGRSRGPAVSPGALRARRKFLRAFPDGFADETYLDWERNYKWTAHQRWQKELPQSRFEMLLKRRQFEEVAQIAIRIESRTNLLFSFEKMALRDAVKSPSGAQAFANGLYDLLHGAEDLPLRFENWISTIASLPRRKTRVLTWPLATVFGFIAQPRIHFFYKPTVTREAARRYGVSLAYQSRPTWALYAELLDFVKSVRRDISDLHPRDMIDMQSFLWIQGSDEYPG